jgi:Dickkopf N-terminal cysteine-rich region
MAAQEEHTTTREGSFDDLAKGLATGAVSRRKALRMLGAVLVGGVLASVPGVALAKPKPGKCTKDKHCPSGQSCVNGQCGTSTCEANQPCLTGECVCPEGAFCSEGAFSPSECKVECGGGSCDLDEICCPGTPESFFYSCCNPGETCQGAGTEDFTCVGGTGGPA